MGYCRPSLPPKTDEAHNDRRNQPDRMYADPYGNPYAASRYGQNRPAVPPEAKKSFARWMFEICHRLIGALLLGLALYNCYTGLILYDGRYLQTLIPYDQLILWGLAGGILGLSAIFWMLNKFFPEE